MTDAARLLGSAPARSFDSVKAGLMRLRRDVSMDEEAWNAASQQTKIVNYALLMQLDAILDWIAPTVRDEKALWDRVDRDLDVAKEARWPG